VYLAVVIIHHSGEGNIKRNLRDYRCARATIRGKFVGAVSFMDPTKRSTGRGRKIPQTLSGERRI
jgi:hypothetical protein